MKTFKRLFALTLSLAMVLSFSTSLASAVSDPSITLVPYSNDRTQLRAASNTFDISDKGMASMTASTLGFSNSTEVTVAMYLERQQNGKWTTVSGMSWSDSASDDFNIDLSKTRAVVSGYHYRLRSEHSATGPNGTEYDTVYSVTLYYGK